MSIKRKVICFSALLLVMILALLNDADSLSWIEPNVYNWLGFGIFLMSVCQICDTIKRKQLLIILIAVKYVAIIFVCVIIGLLCLSVTGGGTLRTFFAAGINFAVSVAGILLFISEFRTVKKSE